MPSRYEGMPLAMVEALLCGRPVIATDVAGHSEIVEEGVTGFLAAAPTVPALRDALERAWASCDAFQEIGQTAARHIRKAFPSDPASVFATKIKALASDESAARRGLPVMNDSCGRLKCS